MRQLIIPFHSSGYTDDGTHKASGTFILEMMREWETAFHEKYFPVYANVLEGHPLAMARLSRYLDGGRNEGLDFGMDLIDGEIDIDANMEMDDHSESTMVYAIGSQIHDDEDEPLLLVKNEALKDDILVLRYEDDNDGNGDDVPVPENVRELSF
ncbi:MAG TPA: hypothetical protein DCY35_03570 [Prolixibacteraceae bacterium]|nr:hypothetical protein [Prolixibacteraceae bacterium]